MPCMSAQSNIVPVPAPESRRTYSAVQRFTASMSLADWIRKALMIALSVSWRRSWIYASSSLPWSWHMSIVPLFSRQAMFSGFSSTNTPTAFMFGLSNRFKFAAFSGVIYRLLFEAKTNPIYSGFSSFAVSMSQGRERPQSLIFVITHLAVRRAWLFCLVPASTFHRSARHPHRYHVALLHPPHCLLRFPRQTTHHGVSAL